eukprot:1160489-Pelagomonas_calceolata.AAC.3
MHLQDKWKAQRKRTGPPTVTSTSLPNPAYSDVPGQAQYPPYSDALHPQVPSPSGRKSPQPPMSPSQHVPHFSPSRPPTPYSNGVVPQYVHQHHLSSVDNEIALGHYQRHLQHLGDSNVLPRHGFKNKETAKRQLHDSVLLEQQYHDSPRNREEAGLQPHPPQPSQQHIEGEAPQNSYNAATWELKTRAAVAPQTSQWANSPRGCVHYETQAQSCWYRSWTSAMSACVYCLSACLRRQAAPTYRHIGEEDFVGNK